MNELYEQFKNASIDDLNKYFAEACDSGDFEVVKFLLTSPQLKKHADIHYNDDKAFNNACYYGHLDIVKYLITSPELKEKINIHKKPDVALELACRGRISDVLEYLIFDLNIAKTPEIQRFFDLMANNNNVIVDKAKKMFEIRELSEKLETNLQPNDKVTSKRLKL